MKAKGHVDVSTLGGKDSVVRRWNARGERKPCHWVGKTSRRRRQSNCIPPGSGNSKVANSKRFWLVEEHAIRGTNALSAIAPRIKCEANTRGEIVIAAVGV